jgi:hypothetical protein
MKTIALEQVDQRITETLKHHGREDPILLTEGSDALGLLLRLPEGTKDWDVDGAAWWEDPMGRVLVIIEAKHGQPFGNEGGTGQPVFGSCKG